MSLKELYALCVILMCNDQPQEPLGGVFIRNALVLLADRHAKSHGFESWMDYYLTTTMPFTEAEVNAPGIAAGPDEVDLVITFNEEQLRRLVAAAVGASGLDYDAVMKIGDRIVEELPNSDTILHKLVFS